MMQRVRPIISSFNDRYYSVVMPECLRHARPRAKRGQGVSGIQTDDWQLAQVGLLDSRSPGAPPPQCGGKGVKHAGMTAPRDG